MVNPTPPATAARDAAIRGIVQQVFDQGRKPASRDQVVAWATDRIAALLLVPADDGRHG
jgi:hypothetical protein